MESPITLLNQITSKFSRGRVKTNKASIVQVDGHLGIEISKEGVSCAALLVKQGKPNIRACQYFTVKGKDAVQKSLTEFVEMQSLEGKNCSLVLSPADYKLLQVEAPEKSLAELKRIMPDRVGDLVPWPISESFTDVFELPDDAYRGRRKLVYVAVAQKQTIVELLALCAQSGLQPDGIHIQELALRNAQVVDCVPEHSHAILRLRAKEGILILMHGNQVYLTRRLSMPLDELNNPDANKREIYNNLLMEIQRSLDYYESQMGKGAVESLSILPASVDIELGIQYLASELIAEVRELNLYEDMQLPHEISRRDKGCCVPAVSVAMGSLIKS